MYTRTRQSAPLGAAFLLALVILTLGVAGACSNGRSATRSEEPTGTSATQIPTQQTATVTPTSSQEEKGMAVNRIVYVGADGNVYTINPDGTDQSQLTSTERRVGPAGHILAQGSSEGEIKYAWPTWSPDGTRLAVSRIVGSGRRAGFSIEVVDTSTGGVTRVYDNEPDTIQVAGEGAPHYVYWSPDSEHLVFIASTTEELSLFTSTTAKGATPRRLTGQGPIYFSWADDSSFMLLHRGDELLMATVSGDDSPPPRSLGTVGLGFRPPVVSKDASTMVYVANANGGDSVFVADTSLRLTEARPVLDVGPFSALLRSPTRDEVGVVDIPNATTRTYERLLVFSIDGTSQNVLVDGTVLAFFWSPDGEKIAYVTLGEERRSFEWWYVERSGGAPVKLAEFLPSSELQTIVNFFDQYAYSHSVWSPDSSQIVFTGLVTPASAGRNGSSAEVNRVYVLETKEGAKPREIATSRFAAWSWN